MGLKFKIEKVLKKFPYNISFEIRDNIVFLYGEVESYQDWVEIGLAVGKIKGVEGVVNKIKWKGYPEEKIRKREERRRKLYEENKDKIIGEYDVVIIGGGVIGTIIARELSKYKLKIALLEKGSDVSLGASKANNGMIHPGVAPPKNTLKRKLNVKGNAMYDRLCEELGVRFKRVGSLWLITPRTLQKYRKYLPGPLYKFVSAYVFPYIVKLKGIRNGVKGIKVIRGKKIFEYEPKATRDAWAALYVPSTGILDPYELVVALAENAQANGVEIHLNTEVVGFIKKEDKVKGVVTTKGTFLTRYVVNAAGVYADEIAELAGAREYTIHPRKGVILLFDKALKDWVRHCVTELRFPAPKHSKGGGINPSIHGNILWGPTAVEIPDKDDTSVHREEIYEVLERYKNILPEFPTNKLIRYFAGVRAPTFTEAFIIRPAKWVRNFLHVAGIQSPGLASAPAIAEYAIEQLKKMGLKLEPNPNFNPRREPIPTINEMSLEELNAKIKEDPRWGNIICPCEMVSEMEIVEAIKRGAKTLDAIKRRTRAGMGTCQGSYCTLKIAEILSRELGVPLSEIVKENNGKLFDGTVRGEKL
ncbi:MAG: FAD/NAD(P)-binding oxidoreductase [Thermococcus sp.]|uniref:FAD-dependent oxidoreductase n=1 Tax=Thermococcus sp. TaxID=35749 RepID=UPI001D1C0DF9|nr:FAD-dependent oxidoreductase [Thermococcus sp.]MBO8173913.1 FAD/NAD(P)-binding oxidoreductase [Thermococcus sp.]